MVGYKLSKNDWVTPFFVIFRSVREKLLVTVSFDHPVSLTDSKNSMIFPGDQKATSLTISSIDLSEVCSLSFRTRCC